MKWCISFIQDFFPKYTYCLEMKTYITSLVAITVRPVKWLDYCLHQAEKLIEQGYNQLG